MPSCPSADARRSAMASAHSVAVSVGGRLAALGDEVLGRADRSWRAGQQVRRGSRATALSRSPAGTTACTRPRALARSALESGAGEEQLARRGAADLADDERRDHRRDEAESHLGQAEHGVVGGDDDVADRGQTDAAAERGAVDASDDRHRQPVERQEHPRHVAGVVQVLLMRVAGHAAHPVQIGAGAERRARAGERRRRARRDRPPPNRPTR